MVEAMIRADCLLPWLLLAPVASPSAAHRLDEYLQAMLVVIEPSSIQLQINLTPGVEGADQVLARIDRDDDRVISKDEARAYAELLKRDLSVRLDGHNVGLKLTGYEFPKSSELRSGLQIIQVEFTANVRLRCRFAQTHRGKQPRAYRKRLSLQRSEVQVRRRPGN
jgi:polyphosphate kinase